MLLLWGSLICTSRKCSVVLSDWVRVWSIMPPPVWLRLLLGWSKTLLGWSGQSWTAHEHRQIGPECYRTDPRCVQNDLYGGVNGDPEDVIQPKGRGWRGESCSPLHDSQCACQVWDSNCAVASVCCGCRAEQGRAHGWHTLTVSCALSEEWSCDICKVLLLSLQCTGTNLHGMGLAWGCWGFCGHFISAWHLMPLQVKEHCAILLFPCVIYLPTYVCASFLSNLVQISVPKTSTVWWEFCLTVIEYCKMEYAAIVIHCTPRHFSDFYCSECSMLEDFHGVNRCQWEA